jgi:hypothetical protein
MNPRSRLMMRRAMLHTAGVVVALAVTLHFAVSGPMWWSMSVYATAWLACGGLYLIALYGWETAADRLEARVRRNLHDERLREDLTRYGRRLRIVRAIHRARREPPESPPSD